MAVYLDTNILASKSGPDTLELSITLALCRELEIDVVLPQLVADELESGRARVAEAAFDALRAAHREARRFAQIPLMPDLPNPGEIGREYARELGTSFRLAPTPDGAGAEGLRREAFRLRPARNGVGARDTGIWITVRDDHLSRAEDGFFVTNNSKDFAHPGTPSVLHGDLAGEVSGHPHGLALCPSLPALVGQLATANDAFVDAATVGASQELAAALTRVVHDRDTMGSFAPPAELTTGQGDRVFATGAVSLSGVNVRELQGYRVAQSNVAIARIDWSLAFELGILEKAGVGFVQRTIPVLLTAVGFVWLGEQPGVAGLLAEVASVVNVRAESL